MPASKQSSRSRFSRLLDIKNHLVMKGNTIKQIALETHTGAVTQESRLQSNTTKENFPREYYAPRPIPRSFFVGEVRKVSSNGSTLDPINARQEVAIEANPTSKACAPPGTCTTPTLQPQTPIRFASAQATTSMSELETIPHRRHEEPRPRPKFHLLLGQQDPASPYFSRRYFNDPYVVAANNLHEPSKDILHHISELDPQAFDAYKTYTYTGNVSLRNPINSKPDYMWIACWPLMNAHTLGCIIEESAFADKVMDILIEKLTGDIAPDVETLKHLFDLNRMGIHEVLRLFVVDRFIEAQQRSPTVLNTSNYPVFFEEIALQSALRNLCKDKSGTVRSGCDYHIHGDKEACYKTRLTPADAMKEQRLSSARVHSIKDSKFAIANSLQNGVKSVDWEQNRVSADQSLRIRTGKAVLDFRRMSKDRPVYQVPLSKETSNSNNHDGIDELDTDGLPNRCSTVLMNRTQPTYDPNKSPQNSPVLQTRSADVTANGTSVPVFPTNTNSSPPSPVHLELPHQSSQAFFLAELEDSSVAPRSTELALKYRSNIDRMRTSESDFTTQLAVVNDEGNIGHIVQKLGGNASPSDSHIERLTTGYERFRSCPGAYPASSASALGETGS